jgi:ornithine carbamoyltransferase
MKLLDINDLSATEVRAIWALASAPARQLSGTVAWSFEGNGIRTRTTFIQAFQELGLAYVELPNLLKTDERASDLAGYLDPFYAMYVVRESNHERLREFAAASSRPVINAMSRAAHPCEVLSDAFYIHAKIRSIESAKGSAKIGLWGPVTNVFQSWHALASVLGIKIHHFCGSEFHSESGHVVFHSSPTESVDVLITDSWPNDFNDPAWSLTREHLARLGNPKLLPTPPFSIGKEVGFDPVTYEGFVGYEQKHFLLSVQRAILMHALG